MKDMDDTHDSDCDYGSKQALPVKPIPVDFDPAVPPETGEEYLQHVQFEAKKYSAVFVADRISVTALNARCDPDVVGLKPTISKSVLSLSAEWERSQVENITRLRNKILKKRLKHPIKNTATTESKPDIDDSLGEWQKFVKNNAPLDSTVLPLRQEELHRILRAILISMNDKMLSVELGRWVYAVAASLDHPLSREACGDLRDIARKCASYLNTEKVNEDEILMTNLIITIVVHYFKQCDLFDTT